MRPVLFALGSVAAFFTLGANCTNFNCECGPCGRAIDLAVFDVDGQAIETGWTVEATVDGFAVDDIGECDANVRFENQCSFGGQTGIYRITLRGTDFETREIAARSAAKSGDDCCNSCISPTPVNAFLEATPIEEE